MSADPGAPITLTRLIACAAVTVLVAACSDAGTTTSTTAPEASTTTARATTVTTGQATTTTTIEPATTTTASTTTTVAEVFRVTVVYAAGVVETERRVTVPLGEPLILTVEADVEAEVHVHGYDLYLDVAPDSPGSIEFDADIPGIFEVELEGSGTLLVELEVTP